ncbi:MAG: ScpA family protein [Bdellovibrionaceae bacterium]|nr:ScpA family protein [Pseudobdellovibrionaceae bacterium]
MDHSLEHSSSVPIVNLSHYSGPLDLLLDLIRRKEMDILKIDIYKITKEYVDFIQHIPQPSLERAGDFIRMASWLLYIKSKSLLPQENQEESTDFDELKKKLSQLLVSYQKFQKISQILYKRNLLGRDCWKSAHTFNLKRSKKDTEISIDKEKGLSQLCQIYHQSCLSKKTPEKYEFYESIPSLFDHLKQTVQLFKIGFKLKLNELSLKKQTKYSFLLSFLSILELSKSGFVNIFQKHLFSNIEIFVKKTVTEEILEKMAENKNISSAKDTGLTG